MAIKVKCQKLKTSKTQDGGRPPYLQIVKSPYLNGQDAQVSQRDCALHCDIDYFARSLKIIRNDTIEQGVSPYWYFAVTMSISLTVSEIFSVK